MVNGCRRLLYMRKGSKPPFSHTPGTLQWKSANQIYVALLENGVIV